MSGNIFECLLNAGYSINERHILETCTGASIVLKERLHTDLRTVPLISERARAYINDMYIYAYEPAYGMPYGFKQDEEVYQVHYTYSCVPESISALGCGCNRMWNFKWDHSATDYTGTSRLVDCFISTVNTADGGTDVLDFDMQYGDTPYGVCSTGLSGTRKMYDKEHDMIKFEVLNDKSLVTDNRIDCKYNESTGIVKKYKKHGSKVLMEETYLYANGIELKHRYHHINEGNGKKRTIKVLSGDDDTEVLCKEGGVFHYAAYIKIHEHMFVAKFELGSTDFGSREFFVEGKPGLAISETERRRYLSTRKEYQFIYRGVVRYIVSEDNDSCRIAVLANLPVRRANTFSAGALGTNLRHYYEPCFF